jgi:hypothetical protein
MMILWTNDSLIKREMRFGGTVWLVTCRAPLLRDRWFEPSVAIRWVTEARAEATLWGSVM